MNRLYFAHSYQASQRRFNEAIWRELMGQGFIAWVDRGLERGTGGRRYPMDVSFNEWMMSRCAGFVAVVPIKRSPYVELEFQLAVRMGLPTLVIAAEGCEFGEGTPDCEYPLNWSSFLESKVSDSIRAHVEQFANRVRSAQAALQAVDPGRRRLRAKKGDPGVAFLPPRNEDTAWSRAYAAVVDQYPAATQLNPMNFRRPWDLIRVIDGRFDLLVVDVGPAGTPREMLGYLEAHSVPLVRVCQGPSPVVEASAEQPGSAFAAERRVRRPYVRATAEDRVETGIEAAGPASAVSLLTDGLHVDSGMRPVLYWSEPEQLSGRVVDLLARIRGFRGGFADADDPGPIPLETHRQAREYFAPPENAARVFLSFAGDAEEPGAKAAKLALADGLARALRFNDLRCFHYLNEDAQADGRLESGEMINQGLEKHVEDSDVIVVLFDASYSQSSFCLNELRQASALRARGLLRVRAYRLSGEEGDLSIFGDINVQEHRGAWSDAKFLEDIVEDVISDCRSLHATLREAEVRQVRSWLEADGCRTGAHLRALLTRAGLDEAELDALKVEPDTDADSSLERLLTLPDDKAAGRRRRSIVTLLLSAIAAADEVRLRYLNRWVLQRSLAGSLPRAAVSFEQVVDVPEAPVAPDQDADIVETGVRLGQVMPGILAGTQPLVLNAESRAAEIPVEWARENADNDAVCLRRPIRWRLPHSNHREALVEALSMRGLPPRWLLLALQGDAIDPEAEVRRTAQTLASLYQKQDWPPEFIKTAICDNEQEVQAWLKGCSSEVVLLSGHMGSGAVHAGGDEIPADRIGQWLASSAVRLVVLNGCEGARPRSTLARHSVAMADRIVQLGKVPEVVAHRRPLTDSDSAAFATTFCTAFARTFDAVAACFDARRAGSEQLRYSPIVISQRSPRSA